MRKSRVLFLLLMLALLGCVGIVAAHAQALNVEQTAPPRPSVQTPTPTARPQPPPSDGTPLSDELNSHLPSWLRFSGELRFRAAASLGDFYRDSYDPYLLTRLRLNMLITPVSWLKFNFQAQDAHVIGAGSTGSLPPLQQDSMDLRIVYVELGDMQKKPFALRVGRQELAFGEERLIGPADWLDTPRSFDGARASFHAAGIRLDAFAASVVKIRDGQFNENTPGNNIYGVYADLPSIVPRTDVQPYFFWRRQSGLTTETGQPGISNFGTVGVRWVGKLPHNNDYDFEMAKQDGSLGTDTIAAWAGHWRAGHTFAKARLTPRLFVEYNYATGDHKLGDGTRGTFDQLFPSAHDMYGLTDQVGWKNIRHIRGGLEIKPDPKWMVSGKYSSYWLADAHDALYNAASIVVAKSPSGAAGTYVGQELEFVAVYKYNTRTTFSGGFGHLFPGSFLTATTPGKSYSFPYASVNYKF